MTIPLLDLKQQIHLLGDDLDRAIRRVLESGAFVGGPEVATFEAAYARYCGVRHAISCANGTDALELALGAVGVGRGDVVITVAHTFMATAEAIFNVGAEPLLIDVDPATLLMDLGALEQALAREARVRAIIPVHLYGSMVPMDRVLALAEKHRVFVIEDSAQAHGARYMDRAAGTFGHMATFSFFPGKNLGAFGDAGAIVTNDDALRARAVAARDHGRAEKYRHDFFGRNSRLDPLQAAVLSVKLPHLDRWNARRREIAAHYDRSLPAGLERVAAPSGCTPVYHQYVIRHPQRDALRVHLKGLGIETGVHYPIPVHLQPAWSARGLVTPALPHSERAAAEVLSLPMFPELTLDAADRVVSAVRDFLKART